MRFTYDKSVTHRALGLFADDGGALAVVMWRTYTVAVAPFADDNWRRMVAIGFWWRCHAFARFQIRIGRPR